MKQTVNVTDFIDAFRQMGRLKTRDTDGNFAPAALRALFDHLEDFEEGTGEELELDVVALCCDYAEYETADEAAQEYGWVPDPSEPYDDLETSALEWLEEQTTVIPFDGGVIVQSF